MNKSSKDYPWASNGTTTNLPQIVATVDDGKQFFSLQTTIALELDHSETVFAIRARHEVIDRHLVELFQSYSLKDLRAAGPPAALREDMRRVINALLPHESVRHAYVTNWVMIPVGY